MNTGKIDLNTGRIFPLAFIFFGLMLSVAGLGFILGGNIIIGIMLLPVCLFVLFTNYGIEINTEEKYFNEYVNIIGYRRNNKIKYSTITDLYFIKSRISQRATSYGGRVSTFHDEIYEAYLRFKGYEERIFLLEDKKKERLLQKLKPISSKLETPVEDRTNI